MDINYINDNNISARYLNGELSEAEEAEFELFLINHPYYVEQLELEDALFRFVPQLEKHSKKRWLNLSYLLELPLRQALAPIAICLIALPAAVFFWIEPSTVNSIQPVFLTNDGFRTSSSTSNQETTLTFQSETDVLLLLLYPDNELANEFEISVRDSDGNLVREFGNRGRGSYGYLSIELAAQEIRSGSYIVEMMPIDLNSTTNVELIPFRIAVQ